MINMFCMQKLFYHLLFLACFICIAGDVLEI